MNSCNHGRTRGFSVLSSCRVTSRHVGQAQQNRRTGGSQIRPRHPRNAYYYLLAGLSADGVELFLEGKRLDHPACFGSAREPSSLNYLIAILPYLVSSICHFSCLFAKYMQTLSFIIIVLYGS